MVEEDDINHAEEDKDEERVRSAPPEHRNVDWRIQGRTQYGILVMGSGATLANRMQVPAVTSVQSFLNILKHHSLCIGYIYVLLGEMRIMQQMFT